MTTSDRHLRKIKHYHDRGDLHELTFSCHGRMPLLTNDVWRNMLAEAVSRALANHQFALVAFVFMPEHVLLLVYPQTGDTTSKEIESLLAAIKRPCSYRIKRALAANGSPMVARLTVP